MLKRIYVNNYKCLTNFTMEPAQSTLLVGLNGTGKSTLFDLLALLRGLVNGDSNVTDLYPTHTLTRWQTSRIQSFEISVQGGPESCQAEYLYRLEIVHAPTQKRCRIKEEQVLSGNSVLFRFVEGVVTLFRDDGSEGPTFNYDWNRSGLTAVVERHDNTRLSWFKNWLRDLYVIRIDPARMMARADEEVDHPSIDLSDFASWYRHLMQEKPVVLAKLFESLKQAINGFESLDLMQDGETSRTLKVSLRASPEPDVSEKAFQLNFGELSDGQRALVGLQALLRMTTGKASTICLDEPENFVALAEIQPIVFDFCDLAESKEGPQVLVASHHPELIDHPGFQRKLYMWRDAGGPTRIDNLANRVGADLSFSESLARGWEKT